MSARTPHLGYDADYLADLWQKFSAAWDQMHRDWAGNASITYDATEKDRFVAYMVLTVGGFKRAEEA